MSELKSRKSFLRSEILRQREQLGADLHARHSREIARRLVALPAYRQARVVLAYMNFGTEFDSRSWVMQILDDGKQLVLPRVDRLGNELELYRVNDPESQLERGSWGIVEPVPERCERLVDLNEVEFALLPGVAFARNGARLGYGGGYYDKLLARMKTRPVLVAAAFALQVVSDVPQEVTDVKVEWIVTEQELIACPV